MHWTSIFTWPCSGSKFKAIMESTSDASFDLHFECFKSTTEAECRKILEQRNNEKTNQAMKNMLHILHEYLIQKELPELSQITDTDLPELLETFYTELHQKTGDPYKLASLKCIRAGLNRHFKEVRGIDIRAGLNRHFKEVRGIDIISDSRFTCTNQMFKGVAKICRKEGCTATRSFPVIPDANMIKLGDYFHQDFSK